MQGVGSGGGFVALCLPGLRQQYQGGCIRRLQTERQVEQNKRVRIEVRHAADIENDPHQHDQGLPAEEQWRTEKTRERFCLPGKLIVSERRDQMGMGAMKP